MRDVEKIIRKVDANMSMEGMPLEEEDRERIRECLTEKISFDDMAKQLIDKYTVTI